MEKPLSLPTEREKKLVDELKTTFLNLTCLDTTDCVPSEKLWLDNIKRLRELVLNDDPREFLRWDIIKQEMLGQQ